MSQVASSPQGIAAIQPQVAAASQVTAANQPYVRVTPRQLASIASHCVGANLNVTITDVAIQLATRKLTITSPEYPALEAHRILCAKSNENYQSPQAFFCGERKWIRDLVLRSEFVILLIRVGNNPLIIFYNVAKDKRAGSSSTAKTHFVNEIQPSQVKSADIDIGAPTPFNRYVGTPKEISNLPIKFRVVSDYENGTQTVEGEGEEPANVRDHLLTFPIEALVTSDHAASQVTVHMHFGTPPVQTIQVGLTIQKLGHSCYMQGASLRILLKDRQTVTFPILNEIKKLSPLIKDVIAESPIRRTSSAGATSEAPTDLPSHTESHILMLKRASAPALTEQAATAIATALNARLGRWYDSTVTLIFPTLESKQAVEGTSINQGKYFLEAPQKRTLPVNTAPDPPPPLPPA